MVYRHLLSWVVAVAIAYVPAAEGATGACAPASVAGFSASLFKFAVINKDDGTDAAGGWQEADATIRFTDWRHLFPQIWTCTVRIQVPLRTEKLGEISPSWAARTSADIATQASTTVMHQQSQWVPAAFCNAWRDEMLRLFHLTYKTLGAKVSA
jgi:hypothetical protein